MAGEFHLASCRSPWYDTNSVAFTLLLQYELPLEQMDAAISLVDGKGIANQGLYYDIGVPNCQGVWPEEYGELKEQGGG